MRFELQRALILNLFCAAAVAQTPSAKPPLTLDEFFNSVDIPNVRLAPDGSAVVIETTRADWAGNRFRSDLWLDREGPGGSGSLLQLTQSGHDRNPEFSPDGRWIAFLSDRSEPSESSDDAKSDKPAQVYVIAVSGGEPFPVTQSEDEVHTFAWATDSSRIYFATRQWTKDQQEAYKKDWKDVVEFRESEHGDVIQGIEISEAQVCITERPAKSCDLSTHAKKLAATPWRVKQLEASPDGKRIAMLTDSRTQRWESLDAYGIYLIDTAGGEPRKLLQREAVFDALHWAPDSRHIFFSFLNGSVEGKYQDAQSRVYWVDAEGDAGAGALVRWAPDFQGAIAGFSVLPSGALAAEGRLGTEVQIYTAQKPASDFVPRTGSPGTYDKLSAAAHSPRLAFVHSSIEEPLEVWLANDANDLTHARRITAFNQYFSERAVPEGKPYRWTTDDGVTAEGMLIYPPGQFGAKHLKMLTLIHGGPEDADGNQFGADWYRWGAMAATQGWLVFEPNYRGSIGYGDKFALGIITKIVSRPGRDILEGVDALVKDGTADADRLAVGGYSYGGYLTNWLITQTTRFKAAVTGAGAVEHVANWGNDDTTYDDAYLLGGLPWMAKQNYNDESAIWQIDKVKTPTHIVAGADDIRVYVGEAYLLERALHTQGVPSKLLIFPGEGHELDKNPWHGKIKVREELKWLEMVK
ncbi:MAG: prolyl oligopeptidase family serine peptidase [Bryobacteraceae bacterium]|jgi:dipeptidyl aminopeptidase/acylaminoacyl peptidase